MKTKRCKKRWKRKMVSAVLLAGILSASCIPVLAEKQERQKNAVLPEVKTISEIDFNRVDSLEGELGGWKVSEGAGTAELVEDSEKGKVLRLQRNTGGNETSLVKESLDIRENTYRYVSVETKLKLISTRSLKNSTFCSRFIGITSAWLPSRRSTLHQTGALSTYSFSAHFMHFTGGMKYCLLYLLQFFILFSS